MRFLIFIYGEKYGKRFLLSEDANQKCRIILTKDEFSIEQTMFLELEYIMQEWYIKETAYYKVSKKQFFQTEKVEENQAAFYKLNTGRKYILKIGEKNISIQCIYCKYDWSTYRTYRLKVCRIIKQSNKVFLTGDDSEQIPCVNILNKNGQWFLNNYGIEPVYINGDFIKENKKLSYGDIIYFFGRIFLFFDDFIAVEQTEEEMNVFCLEEIKVNEFIQDKGIIAPMLKESFHRAPRIMEHLEKLTLQIENPPILGMFGMEEQRSVFYGYRCGFEHDVSNVGNECIFDIWDENRRKSSRDICIFRNIYGCYVGNVFSFVDYDFQAIREETKKGTSG